MFCQEFEQIPKEKRINFGGSLKEKYLVIPMTKCRKNTALETFLSIIPTVSGY
jgi:hypothetical protein